MNLTAHWMQSEWIQALGWTFVHSLWQIALIGLLLFAVLRLIPGRSAHTRYTLSTLALWLIVMTTLSTFIIMLPETNKVTEIAGGFVFVQAAEPMNVTERISAWLEVRMPMMLSIWLGGVAILMLRLAVSLAWVRHIRSTAIPQKEIQFVLDHILKKLSLKIKPVASGSELVPSPVTIGHVKPLILFPVAILNQLTPQEVEAILTHELAHILRRDYLSNLVQSFIETLFYYHPVTWWISAMVRTERENRADDLAVSWCGDHLGYAKALLTVQEMQMKGTPALSIGFASKKGLMLARIQRILNVPYKNHNQMEKTVLLSLCAFCFLAFTLSSHTPIDNPPEKSESAASSLFSDLEMQTDTIPHSGIYRIHKKTDDQDISIEVEDGDIRQLKIDGKEIQPSEFEAYDDLIDKLFGLMDSPPSMEGFAFSMPPMPAMPQMPVMPRMPGHMSMMEGFTMPPMPPMPEMPEMPAMPEMEWNELFNEEYLKAFGEGSNIAIWNGEGMNKMKFFSDSLPDGKSKIIIIRNGDSTVVFSPHFSWDNETPQVFQLDESHFKDKDWKKHQEVWREQAKQWKERARAQQDQWREQQQELREQFRHQSEVWRAQQELERELHRGSGIRDEEHQRAMEEIQQSERHPRAYALRTPRLNLSEEMVREGLVEFGQKAEVLLTPNKLKINGKKMPDTTHQKYLRMYEQQQGIQLSGNSRVEFTIKSRQRM